MDRIGLAGAQGTGKTTLARQLAAHYGYRYIDAGVGECMTKLGVTIGKPMPLYERLQAQLVVAEHIAERSSGNGNFVMDRTPVDVMAYTIDLFGQTNDERATALFWEIQKVCADASVGNYNAIFGLRPGIELSVEDRARGQRGSLDSLYVRRIDSIVCGELNNLNLFADKGDLLVGFMPPELTDLDARLRAATRFIDKALNTHARPVDCTLH